MKRTWCSGSTRASQARSAGSIPAVRLGRRLMAGPAALNRVGEGSSPSAPTHFRAGPTGTTPGSEPGERGSNPWPETVFHRSSEAERPAVNRRQRRFESFRWSTWLAGPHGEGTGLQNRPAGFDPRASLCEALERASALAWPRRLAVRIQDSQSCGAGSIPAGVNVSVFACPVGPTAHDAGLSSRR